MILAAVIVLTDMEITGTDFVTIWTRDFPAAERFYGETLGLTCSERYDRIPGGEFETGNLTLQVLDCTAVGTAFAPHPPLALHVADVAAARAELEAKGVEFLQQFDTGVCHQALFTDPDGNVFALHHPGGEVSLPDDRPTRGSPPSTPRPAGATAG